ncbi:MAG: nucleotidyltransferase [Lachnospiraceae bacterium]|nr:nucleotidyltransferase [Lachnospiraceae bacterium]
MIVNGIIAEYNPFHNGHQHHLDQCRKITGADYSIVVLGSNFTQRGEPALLDKFVRAKMALESGADLVIELPISHTAASAEYFATGAVSILDQLGVVDHLCFGSECGNTEVLRSFAEILLEEPEGYSKNLKSGLAAGHSYPSARNRAITDYAPALAMHENVLGFPNNILGIEYIKAILKLDSSMKPLTIPRAGSGYHDRMLSSTYVSAKAIREALLSSDEATVIDSLRGQIPEAAHQTLKQSLAETPPITLNDFSEMLLYQLLMTRDRGYDRFVDVNDELADRIGNQLNSYQDYAAFCNQLKSKNMTYTRISRCLLHILLDYTKEDLQAFGNDGKVPYARVLGFRKEAAPLMTELQNKSEIPVITKLAEAKNQLSPHAYELLCKDLRRGQIFESVAARKTGRALRDERQIPLVIKSFR